MIHAPLYAVLLAPIEFFFPLSVVAVKVWTLLWGVLAIVLMYRWISSTIGITAAAVAVLLFSLNPLVLLYSSEALSEIPFIVLILLTFVLCERQGYGEGGSKVNAALMILTVAAVALEREVGIAMVAAVVIYLLMNKQRKRAATLLFFCLAALFLWYMRNKYALNATQGSQRGNLSLVFEHFVTSPEASIVNEFALRMWLNFKEYASQLGGMLFYPLSASHQVNLIAEVSTLDKMIQSLVENCKVIIIFLSAGLMFIGIYRDRRTSTISLLRLLFVVFYLGVILAYPVHDIRFLVPLLPLMIFYVVLAGKWLMTQRFNLVPRMRLTTVVGITVVLMLPNVSGIYNILKANIAYQRSPLDFYQSLQKLTSYPSIFTQPWTLLGSWIQQNIPEGETIASPSKELAVVVGDRQVMELDPGIPLPLFEKLIRDHRVNYILAPIRWQDLKVYEFLMSESSRLWFEEVHRVANLVLLKIHSRFLVSPPDNLTIVQRQDTTTASGFLRLGREQIMSGNYDGAILLLNKGLTLAQEQPQLIYQLIIAYAQKGDRDAAVEQFRRFVTLPQVGSYIVLARFQLQAMELFLKAQSSKNTEEQSIKLYDVASSYWKSGYYKRATTILNASLQSDSSYFVGLLWGFHYALQLGDTARAFHYLKRLEVIDAVNPVVTAFGRVRTIIDSLARCNNNLERSRLHFSLANVYSKIELNEEALDEAERALGEDHRNTTALLFIADMFERRSLFPSATQTYQQVISLEPDNTFARGRIEYLKTRSFME